MTPEQFCYWMQGFFEMSSPKVITEGQLQMIKEHLKTVFQKETPEILSPPDSSSASQPVSAAMNRDRKNRDRDIANAISLTKRIC